MNTEAEIRQAFEDFGAGAVVLGSIFEEEIEKRVLVVGGGYAGLTAAQAATELGCPVTLLESTDATVRAALVTEFGDPEADAELPSRPDITTDEDPAVELSPLSEEGDLAEIRRLVEGIGADHLSELQNLFISNNSFQCGFCAPGIVLATHELLREHPEPTREQVQEAISGNLCRCTGYEPIIEAVLAVTGSRAGEEVAP